MSAGLALVGAGLLLMRGLSSDSGWTELLPGFLLIGFGMGLANPTIASTAIGVVPVARSGMASGISNTFRQVGIATGVAGRCPIPEVLDDLLVVLDDVMLVREDSIKAGMRMIDEHAGLVVEPSAALGVAALLEEPEWFAGRRVTTILCGSNVSPTDFARWVLKPVSR